MDEQFKMCYYISQSEQVNWAEAKDKCAEMDSQLVEIRSPEKSKKLQTLGKYQININHPGLNTWFFLEPFKTEINV